MSSKEFKYNSSNPSSRKGTPATIPAILDKTISIGSEKKVDDPYSIR